MNNFLIFNSKPTSRLWPIAPPGTGLGVTHWAWTCSKDPKQGVGHDLILKQNFVH